MITDLQKLWLNTRGGRDEGDTLIYKDRLCVEIGAADGETRYLPVPKDEEILEEYTVVSYSPGYPSHETLRAIPETQKMAR